MAGLSLGVGLSPKVGLSDGVGLGSGQLDGAAGAANFQNTFTSALPADWTFTRTGNQTYEDVNEVLQTETNDDVAVHTYDGGVAQGVLLEDARTNLCLYSEDTSNAAWVASNMTKGSTSTTTPAGDSSTTVELTASAANGTLLQTVTSASDNYVYSVFLQRKTGTGNVDITVDGGTTWTTKTLTGAWTRFDVTDASETNPQVGIRIVTSGDAVNFWGSMLEKDADFPSSYIKTTTASATRNVTSLTRSWDFPANGISGQIKVRPQFDTGEAPASAKYFLTLVAGTDWQNRLSVEQAATTGAVYLRKYVGGTPATTTVSAETWSAGDLVNIRFRADSDGIHLWVNSEAKISQTSGIAPDDWTTLMDNIKSGNETGNNRTFQAVESLKIWNEAKSDAFLSALT